MVHILGLEPRVEGTGGNARNTGIPKIGQYLKDKFTFISYNNYDSSGAEFATEASSAEVIKDVADNCLALLQHLGISRAHLFAHRQVGYAAIKLAADRPDLVRTIGLLDFENAAISA